ncbi:caspase family protein [Sediminitomix flava]|uniref:WD domain G-beta repeat uncharacterized protein n=1 Tax=Sediminitomix flava TaxID=379075 RepID=A0A315Z8Y2_SEDFL|nr:caspase family protein [Sediminitomix flava]PWJ39996.1 WD domain G-beta repeat uncharacterized protein [Sediminitomix flava]
MYKYWFYIFCFLIIPSFCLGQGEVVTFPTEGHIKQVDFSPNGKYFAIAHKSRISIWYSGSRGLRSIIQTDLAFLHDISFSADNEKIYFVGDKKVFGSQNTLKNCIWEYNLELDTTRAIICNIQDKIYNLTVNSNNQEVSIGTKGGDIFIYHLKTGSKINSRNPNKGQAILDLFYAADGTMLGFSNTKGEVGIWDLLEDELIDVYQHDDWVRAIAISPNKQLIASGDDKGCLLIHSLENDSIKSIKLPKKHTDRIYDIAFSIDSKYLASSGKDDFFNIWEADSRQFRSQNIVKNGGTITAIEFDPTGKYLATGAFLSEDLFMWNVTNLNIIPPIVYRDEEDIYPPLINISHPVVRGGQLLMTQEEILIKGNIIDEYGVSSVSVNGMKLDLTEQNDFQVYVELAMGQNDFQIKATDINGNEAIREITVTRREDETLTATNKEGHNYLLAVGINDYENYPLLNNAVSDARAIVTTLEQKYTFTAPRTIELYDNKATLDAIQDTLKYLVKNMSWNDNLMIYFSGHGIFDEILKEGYWVPVNGVPDKMSTLLSNAEIIQNIKNIRAQHIFIVADACFSGSLFNQSSKGFIENVAQYRSRWALASGRLETVGDGIAGQHSPFCQTMLDFLNQNNVKYVAVSDLVQYVKKNVAEESYQTPIGNPLRSVGDEGGEFIFERISDTE